MVDTKKAEETKAETKADETVALYVSSAFVDGFTAVVGEDEYLIVREPTEVPASVADDLVTQARKVGVKLSRSK